MNDIYSWVECSLAFSGQERLFWRLLKEYGTPENVLGSHECPRVPDKEHMPSTQSILSACKKHGIKIVSPDSILYPQCFHTTTPPIVFYLKGDGGLLSANGSIAIIGARKASPYSLDICRSFSSELASKGAVIISGFASGVDRCAHLSCLEAGGKTVAVLGGGIGYDYPAGSLHIQKEITAKGAVISEYPPFSKPMGSNFTRRNRLIAALCQKLLVVEASGKSGCLNTVSHALDQGKEIFVIPPHDISAKTYEGQVRLIRDGAMIAFEPTDLL